MNFTILVFNARLTTSDLKAMPKLKRSFLDHHTLFFHILSTPIVGKRVISTKHQNNCKSSARKAPSSTDALILSLKSKAEGDDGLVLLISENGSHITIPTLLLLEALNKPRFSINKSLRDIKFCFCFKLFSRAFVPTDFWRCYVCPKTWFAGIEIESLNVFIGNS